MSIAAVAGILFYIEGFNHGLIFEDQADSYIHELTHDMRYASGFDCDDKSHNNTLWQEAYGEPVGYIGGGSIDLDPDLSPSYALDFAGGTFYHIILPFVGWGVGISALFLVPYFILKRKNIPSKPYLSLIVAGLLLFFGMPTFVSSLQTFAIIFSQPDQILTWVFDILFVLLLIPIFVLIIAGIILYRSTVIRTLIHKARNR